MPSVTARRAAATPNPWCTRRTCQLENPHRVTSAAARAFRGAPLTTDAAPPRTGRATSVRWAARPAARRVAMAGRRAPSATPPGAPARSARTRAPAGPPAPRRAPPAAPGIERRRQRRDARLLALGGGGVQRLAVGEVLEDRAQRHAGARRDARHRRLRVACLEERQERLDDGRPRRRRSRQTAVLGPQRAAGRTSCMHSASSVDHGSATGNRAETMGAHYTLYGMDVSYFTGKLEAYLRYKRVPYRRVEATWRILMGPLRRHTGVAKVPVVETPAGEWLQDSTPMIDWFEARFPDGAVLPDGSGAGILLPPARRLRRRVVVAAGAALPLELPSRRAPARRPHRQRGARRRAAAARAARVQHPPPPVPAVRRRRRRARRDARRTSRACTRRRSPAWRRSSPRSRSCSAAAHASPTSGSSPRCSATSASIRRRRA